MLKNNNNFGGTLLDKQIDKLISNPFCNSVLDQRTHAD
jgi:hypothetical protein